MQRINGSPNSLEPRHRHPRPLRESLLHNRRFETPSGSRSRQKSPNSTTGTAGIGRETVLLLAAHAPAHIFFTGRNAGASESVIAAVHAIAPAVAATFLPCDQADLASVAAAARTFAAQSERLDVLIGNAGIMAQPAGLTADGFERQFGVNHLAHALFVQLLLPRLRRSADPRVVLVTSLGFALAPGPRGVDLAALRSEQDLGFGGPWKRYGQSKLANILHAQGLAAREPAITAVSVHPGVADTELAKGLGWASRWLINVTTVGQKKTPRECAFGSCWASTAPKGPQGVESGKFYEPVGKKGTETKFSKSEKLRDELWRWSEEALGAYQL